MFREAALHIEIHARIQNLSVIRQLRITHGPHELEGPNVQHEADDKHDNVEGGVVVAEHSVDEEEKAVGAEDHVSVEGQRFHVFLCYQARAPRSLFTLLFVKLFHF